MNESSPLNGAVSQFSENRAAGCYKLFIFGSKRHKQQLLAGLLLVQVGANVHRVVRVDGALVEFDVLNNSFFVDNDVRALRPLVVLVLDVVPFQDAVVLKHFLVHVAEEGKFDVNLLCECRICCWGIHTDAKNCRIVRIDFTGSESSLDRLKLFCSTTRKSENIYSEEYILFAAEVRKLDGLPFVAEQAKIGSLFANFQSRLGDLLRTL